MKPLRETLLYLRLAQVQLAIHWSERGIRKATNDLAAALQAKDRLMAELRIQEFNDREIPPSLLKFEQPKRKTS